MAARIDYANVAGAVRAVWAVEEYVRRTSHRASASLSPGPMPSRRSDGRAVTEDVYMEARPYFAERELVDLTMAVIAINACNRLAVTFREEPGTYRPRVDGAVAAEPGG